VVTSRAVAGLGLVADNEHSQPHLATPRDADWARTDDNFVASRSEDTSTKRVRLCVRVWSYSRAATSVSKGPRALSHRAEVAAQEAPRAVMVCPVSSAHDRSRHFFDPAHLSRRVVSVWLRDARRLSVAAWTLRA
jgi:ribosomal protein L28